MFSSEDYELDFFDHFIRVLCERDARIHASFDADTIRRVLIFLADATRTSVGNVGPIGLSNVQQAFEAVVGQLPVEEASVMLQRLPALGRVEAESTDRQFIDTYILDGLRAHSASQLPSENEGRRREIAGVAYRNPLGSLGQRLLAKHVTVANLKSFISIARLCADGANSVLSSDIAGSIVVCGLSTVDFAGLRIQNGHFVRLDLTKTLVKNLTIDQSIVGVLVIPASPPVGTIFGNLLCEEVVGVTSKSGLPAWLPNLEAEKFDSVESVAQIRRIGLSPNHVVLVAIIRKTFFQKGAGRKEEALFRGLGQTAQKSVVEKITNLLLSQGILKSFRGEGGMVYTPNRSHAGRMKKMLYELQTSQDPIWVQVEAF